MAFGEEACVRAGWVCLLQADQSGPLIHWVNALLTQEGKKVQAAELQQCAVTRWDF